MVLIHQCRKLASPFLPQTLRDLMGESGMNQLDDRGDDQLPAAEKKRRRLEEKLRKEAEERRRKKQILLQKEKEYEMVCISYITP